MAPQKDASTLTRSSWISLFCRALEKDNMAWSQGLAWVSLWVEASVFGLPSGNLDVKEWLLKLQLPELIMPLSVFHPMMVPPPLIQRGLIRVEDELLHTQMEELGHITSLCQVPCLGPAPHSSDLDLTSLSSSLWLRLHDLLAAWTSTGHLVTQLWLEGFRDDSTTSFC